MVYRIDNRPKKSHRGKYTMLGIILGMALAFGGLYVYDNHKDDINGNVDSIKQFAIKQIPKDSPIIQVTQGDSVNKPIEQQPIQTSHIEQTQTVSIDIPSLEKQIHEQINQIRQSNGLNSLVFDSKVASIARTHSQDMLDNNYFDHITPNGVTAQNRFFNAHYPCFPIGENIVEINLENQDMLSTDIVNTWMSSPEHKTNILESIYASEGIGVSILGDNVMVTQDFC